MQAKQLFCWSGIIGTEHTTSGSNEEKGKFYLEYYKCRRCSAKNYLGMHLQNYGTSQV